jgi:hypothetical protein
VGTVIHVPQEPSFNFPIEWLHRRAEVLLALPQDPVPAFEPHHADDTTMKLSHLEDRPVPFRLVCEEVSLDESVDRPPRG